ncbi:GDP-mannose mannosyl hydrolase [Burkholderia vietnamiensis]|uniref:GDP-mannose mannosyl hydrolase n=2 Tax=Burkholderia vietnamiensis TaxID=60552 RepID=UPI003D2F535B
MMNTVGDNSAALWVYEIGTPIHRPTQTPSRSDAGTFPQTSWSLSAMLPLDTFLRIVDATPLVAIDLIISNEDGAYLLGHRTNRPAQGFWFVPGGRIHKNERLDDAFRRIARDELGCSDLKRADAELVGIYDHLYEDNFGGAPDITTHYVVMGYKLRGNLNLVSLPNAQHTAYRWATADEIAADRSIHPNTQAYFAPAR